MTDVFDKPVIARCQLHKIRNVRDRLPDKLRAVGEKRMRRAYHADSVVEAGKQFRRVNGHLHLRQLRDTLNAQCAETVSAACHDADQKVA